MNILYIAHEGGKNYNGASRSLMTIVRHLKNEHNVYVVIPQKGGMLEKKLRDIGVKPIVIPFYRCCVHKCKNPIVWSISKLDWKYRRKKRNNRYVQKLANYCKQNSIELIHSNSSVVDLGNDVAERLSVPHVWHFREFGEEDFEMFPLMSNEERISRIDRKNNYIVCVSDAVKKKYDGLLSKAHIQTVYNGIDISINCNRVKHENFNLLVTGVINPAKGQDIAIKATKFAIQKYADIHLYIAGSGDISNLSKLLGENGSNIHFCGQVVDMSELRSKMDVELVCSRSEAFGRITIEAMLCKLPVIGSNSGGTTELIEDGIDGFLFTCGEYKELAKNIIWCHDHRDVLMEMGERGYIKARMKYSEDRLIKDIIQLYVYIKSQSGNSNI